MKRIDGCQYGVTGRGIGEGEYNDPLGRTIVRTTLTANLAVIVIHDTLTPLELDRLVWKINEVRNER